MRATLWFVAVVGGLALWLPMGNAQRANVPNKFNLAVPVVAIVRLEGVKQKEQLAAFSQEYADLETELIVEFRKASGVEQKCAVAYLMGRFRSPAFAPDLAENLTLKSQFQENNDKKPLWGTFPAMEALVSIGSPAIKPMLVNIQTARADEFRRLSTEVIRKIEGTEVARFILEMQIMKTKDEAGRKRLEGALEYLEKVKG